MFRTFCILISLFSIITNCQDVLIKTVNSGSFKGKSSLLDGRKYNVFLAISYAQPPIDKLRFRPPNPLKNINSENVVDASKRFSKACMQGSIIPEAFQSEDCLYLNVVTPADKAPNGSGYPVMVWIHGGAFILGSASQFPVSGISRNLVSRDVIVVTINYRLGIFGFFTTESSSAPGNLGFLDQIEAIKWVKNNIQFFGGDPNSITIFGESAGGASVSLLTISPLAQGLFNRAILMSGSAYGSWVTMYDSDLDDPSATAAKLLGCRNETSVVENSPSICPYGKNSINPSSAAASRNDEVECMQKLSTSEINKKLPLKLEWMARIDGTFLPSDIDILMKKRSPLLGLMIGVDRDEYGIFPFIPSLGDLKTSIVQSRQDFENEKAYIEVLVNCKNYKYPQAVILATKFAYENLRVTDNCDERGLWFQRSVNLISSGMFWIPAYRDAMEAVKNSLTPVYVYSFDWKNAQHLFDNKTNFSYSGAVHASELVYLFDMGNGFYGGESTGNNSRDEMKMTETMGKLWTNFAKSGNPTPDMSIDNVIWQRFDSNLTNYFSINIPVRMLNNFYSEDVKIWTQFIPKLEEAFRPTGR